MNKSNRFYYTFLLILLGMVTAFSNQTFAQYNNPYVRIAKIVIDSTQLENYRAALREHARAAVGNEPGVITMYAVYDKEQPTHVTVFEMYADVPAYQSHIQTPHFFKYKSVVKDMVKSLVLTDVVPIALETKLK